MILVPYHEAKPYIEEADVLLFRGKGLSSWLIKRYGSGVHSHAGMAHWDGDNLECEEFREFKGGRAVSLKSQSRLSCSLLEFYCLARKQRQETSKNRLSSEKQRSAVHTARCYRCHVKSNRITIRMEKYMEASKTLPAILQTSTAKH